MTALWDTPLPGVLLTLAVYLAFVRLQTWARGHALFNPVAWTIAVLAALLLATGLDYRRYFESARILHLLLGPATVALAVQLVQELPRFRRLLAPMAAGLLAGNVAALTSAVLLGRTLGADRVVLLSLAPKSVTTPIAMGIAERIGGAPSLTAVLVILTGVLGAVLGPWTLDRLRVRDAAVRGIAMGVAAHGLGTAVVYQESPEAGAASGLAMGLSGLVTAAIVPLLVGWLGLG